MQLIRAYDVKQAPGRPKTDKLDAVWLAKLTERGMMRPGFVPPAEIRALRDYTRLRADLTRERTRYWQRLEKLLEDALIKVSAVASHLDTVSARDMVEALIAGERDPHVLAGLARGRMKVKHAALVQALTGRFDAHHGELARMLLDQIDALTAQIGTLTARTGQLIAAMPAAQGVDADGTTGPGAGLGAGAPVLPAVDRLDEVTGIGRDFAQAIIAEAGLDMSRFPTPGHLVSWARLSPRTIQSGAKNRAGPPARATRTCGPSSARPPQRPGGPIPSSATGTGAWPAAAASSKPWPRSPAPSSSSSGTCSPAVTPGSATWGPATTPAGSTRTARPAATSASSRPSATPSPSRRPPDSGRESGSAALRRMLPPASWGDLPVRPKLRHGP